jgi:hypothetical protein
MNLITALIIYSGDMPEMRDRMLEAAQRIEIEQTNEQSVLCQETIRALLRIKQRQLRKAAKTPSVVK